MTPFEKFADVWDIPSWGSLVFSPDGRELAWVMSRGDRYQVYRQRIDADEAVAVTDWEEETPRNVASSTDGTRLAILADRNGDEFNQVRLLRLADGSVSKLTDAPGVQHWLGEFSPDGSLLAYAGNDREPTEQDLILRQLAGEHRVRFKPRPDVRGILSPGQWSPDGTRITFEEFVHPQWSDLRLGRLDGRDEVVLEAGERGAFAAGPWLPDGSAFYVRSDVDREFVGLFLYDLASRRLRPVVDIDWDVEAVGTSRDGSVLAVAINEDGVSRVHVQVGSEERRLPFPDGSLELFAVSPSGGHVAIALGTGRSAPDLYVGDTTVGSVRRLTRSMRGVDPATLRPPTLLRVPRPGRTGIPAWLYRPPDAKPERRAPVVVSVHGGPMSQERLEYRYLGMYHYLLERGIGVLAPNITGSTGYGRSYTARLNRDWGGVDLDDLDAIVAWLREEEWVDPARLAIYGGSYGGYLVLAALSMRPGLFATGAELVGPSNLVTLIQTGPPTWRTFDHAAIGHPERDGDLLLSRSPLTHADRIDVPLFVIQGGNDPRVPHSESDQMVAALQARGVTVRYDVYVDEGHGFVRHANRLRAFRDAADWLVEHLAPPPQRAVPAEPPPLVAVTS